MKRASKPQLAKQKGRNALGFVLSEINPMTETQRQVFETFMDNHLLLHGLAGTGKTFVSLYLSLREMFEYGNYKKIVIIRSAVPTRDLGFMPGSLDEKLSVYEQPYREIINQLFSRGDAYDILKQKNLLDFMSTSFIRGLTLDNSIIIVDEIQNMKAMEIHSVLTRVGKNSKFIAIGDIKQRDIQNSGIADAIVIMKKMGVEFAEFAVADIVRSDFVKQYIIARNDLEEIGAIKSIS